MAATSSGRDLLRGRIPMTVITGFLGGLTTFSTFSAESVILLQRGAYGWAFLHTALHLLGSIAACIAGLAVWRQVYA